MVSAVKKIKQGKEQENDERGYYFKHMFMETGVSVKIFMHWNFLIFRIIS